jgi:plasmid stabilization system protein ParE
MSLRKSDDFIADVEKQYAWYVENADWNVAEGYLCAVEATCRLLEKHPLLGPRGDFSHPRLSRVALLCRVSPFQEHLLFYEVTGENIVMRRAMHGRRNLPQRLVEPPGAT